MPSDSLRESDFVAHELGSPLSYRVTSNKEIRDRLLVIARRRGLTPNTIYRYRRWVRKFLEYHEGILLEQVDLDEATEFLESLSHLSASTRHQAQNALEFLFRTVLQKDLSISLQRPKRFAAVFFRLHAWRKRRESQKK